MARKALIMARSIGIKADMSDVMSLETSTDPFSSLVQVNIEALYPAEFAKLPVPEFMARLNELDVAIAEQVRGNADNSMLPAK